MNINRNICFILLLAVCPDFFGINAQVPTLPKIEFEHISKGLSQNTVTCILQDTDGFMWMGTRNGLNRYDGVEFKEYKLLSHDSVSLGLGHVVCIYQDSNGVLWVGTRDRGLSYYLPDREVFIYPNEDKPENRLTQISVTSILEDKDQDFWVATARNGLFLYNRQDGTIYNYRSHSYDANSLSGNNLSMIKQDPNGNIWVGTQGHGLNLFDKKANRFYSYKYESDNPSSLSNNDVRKILITSKGDLWIGTHHGLNLMYRDTFNRVAFRRFHQDNAKTSLSYSVISALEEDNYGNIWIGMENEGLSVYNSHEDAFSYYFADPKQPASLGGNSIWSIYKDNTGIMWLGSLNSGVNKYNPQSKRFSHYLHNPFSSTSLSHNYVSCFLEDKQGNLWIGTDGGGLNYLDRQSGQFRHFKHDPQDPTSLGSDAVLSLIKDPEGRLWVGTWEGGLNLYDPRTESFTRYIHNPEDTASIASNNIFAMMIDSRENFWIAASGGALDLFNPESGDFRHFGRFSHCSIFKILEDQKGNIWIGSDGFGLSRLDTTGSLAADFKHYNDLENHPRSVISMLQDSKGNFWLGTEGSGVVQFDPETSTFTSYLKEPRLSHQVINGILEDDNGYLWFSTNRGIWKFDPIKITFRNYDNADGIQADEFIRGSYNSCNDGKMLFGGINGFNEFYPDAIRDNLHVEAVYLNEFRINQQVIKPGQPGSPLNKHINKTSEITLSHDQSIFSIDYVTPDYTHGENNQYKYILEGYDDDWQMVGSNRTATYTKIPHGRYLFKVKGSNSDGIWNEQAASLIINISPPWWKSTPAILVYLVLAVGGLWGSRQLVVYRERLNSQLQLEHLELQKLQEMDDMKSRFFANISHEFRTPLTLIQEPLRNIYSSNLTGKTRQQFRVMLRNTQKLLTLTNRLLDLSKLGVGSLKLMASEHELSKFLKIISESFKSQAERQSIKFKFIDKGCPERLFYDEEKLEDVMYNLLSNALKFTPEYGSVIMEARTVTRDDQQWAQVKITDSGIGIPSGQVPNIFDRFYQASNRETASNNGSGIGLALTKELVELHQGIIRVISEEGKGTTVIVQLPCGTEHLRQSQIVASKTPEVTIDGELTGIGTIKEDKKERVLEKLPLILVVEDDEDMRAYISEYLETNHRVVEAGNGQEALTIATKALPELIISDIHMPVMDGVELCKRLKQDSRTSHIPVLLLTGRIDQENELRSLEHGADYYFTKPFNSKLLQLTVNNILQSREVLRNHYTGSDKASIEPSQVKMSSGSERFIQNALACVEENISNPEFSVIELGKGVGLSRMQLYRKLKSVTGQSPNEFIRTIRLKRAAQLLERSNYTISEITYQVGFNDLQYFRECFKKHFDVTPSKFLDQRNQSI